MLLLRKVILFFSLLLSIATPSFASTLFTSSEHIFIGDNVNLYFSAEDKGKKAAPLHLPNGLILTYGEIISMGDLYGDINNPISHGKSDEERAMLFIAAFNALAINPKVQDETKKLLAVLHAEQKIVESGMKNGEDPEIIYKRIANETGRQLNCITGGGCDPSSWWLHPGRYLKLAEVDFDHFGNNAIITYQTGHRIALQTALHAHQKHDVKLLELAYALNAFATHFLSDRFATGHIRTPRNELYEHVTPSVVGSVLANFMHNEENLNGLHLHNLRGDHWMGYGDTTFFTQKNKAHRQFVEEAIQYSASQIFYTYLHGQLPTEDQIVDMVPYADEANNAAVNDLSTLFYWNDSTKKLMRRQDLTNMFDRHWTDNWWGWSTLAELERIKGLPSELQARLALSQHGKEAMQMGLITDKHIIEYIKSKK